MMKKNSKFLFILFMLDIVFYSQAFAAGGSGGHGLDEHAIKTIIYQAINVFVLFGGLIYFLKKPVQQHFKQKKESFIASASKAESARAAAESEHMQIQVKLTKLQNTADESISRAKAEAASVRNQMVAEAEAVSKRIKDEAAVAAKLEYEKAKARIRDLMLQEAIEASRAQLSSKVSNEDHARLQGNFINNMQAGQQ
jgi:F-type H+-transporting ATPase subunit b